MSDETTPPVEPEIPAPAPALANDGRPRRPLPAGAGEALGGAPTRIPAARAAQPQRPRRDDAAPVIFGNPTFDPPSPEVVERRQAIEQVKTAARRLIAEIERTCTGLQPQIENLSANAKEVRSKENFDPKEVVEFLSDLQDVIKKLKK